MKPSTAIGVGIEPEVHPDRSSIVTNTPAASSIRSVAESYERRPTYPDETYLIILSLLENPRARILDVGCGTGRLARTLVDHAAGVDAVDFSHEMIRVGRSLDMGGHPNLNWIHGRVEEVEFERVTPW